MRVVLFSGDLLVISRVQNAAAAASVTVQSVGSLPQAVEKCAELHPPLIIADLSAPALDIVELVKELRSAQIEDAPASPPRIIAFGPHVHEDRLAAAREAGCDEVLSRGQFFGQIEAILAG